METKGRRPYYFLDNALNAAKDLALLLGKITKRVVISNNANNDIDISHHIVANVNKILDTIFEEYGSIEGKLKMPSAAKSWYFNIYDNVTGVRILLF